MVQPISMDLRKRIVRDVDGGMSRNASAKKYGVAISTVVKLMQRWRTTGSMEPDQQGTPHDFKLAPHEARVRRLLAERADITLMEMKALLAKAGIEVSRSAIDRFLTRLGLGYKKNRSRQRARQARRPGSSQRLERGPGVS